MERTYSTVYSRDEELNKRLQNGTTIGLIGALVLGFAGVLAIDYRTSTKEYNKVLNEVNSIPALESAHNYREAERLENEAWHFIADQRRNVSWGVSDKNLQVLADKLNSNNTHGASRGEPLD